MRKLVLTVFVLGVCLVGINAYAEDYLIINESGYTQEVIVYDTVPPATDGIKVYGDTSVCTDLDGNTYAIENRKTVRKVTSDGIMTDFAVINELPDHNDNIDHITMDMFGNMFVVVNSYIFSTEENPYPLVKISGFTPISESQPLIDLQAQINNLDSALQSQISDLQVEVINQQALIGALQLENQEQQEDIDRILSHPVFRFWHYGIYPHAYPYIYFPREK